MTLSPQDASRRIRDICSLAPIIPVLVLNDSVLARPLAEALVSGGLPALEVTLRTPAALEIIRKMSSITGGFVGAGTLITPNDVRAAKAAGRAQAELVARNAQAAMRLRLQSGGVQSPSAISMGEDAQARARLMQTIPAGVNVPSQVPPATASEILAATQGTPSTAAADILSATRRAQLEFAARQAQAALAQLSGGTAPIQQRSVGQTIYENVVGSGEVDTPGERIGQAIGDFVTSVPGGVARGAAEVVGLPGTADDLISAGINRLVPGALPSVDGVPDGPPFSGQSIRGLLSNATNGATEWEADSRAGQFGGTVGEFLPGGTGGQGLRGLLAYGVAPGVTSEAAGLLTEGTPFEPYARMAAAVATPFLSGPMAGLRNTPVVSDPERQRLVDILTDVGATPTAGQASNSPILQNFEGTIVPRPRQLANLSAAAMDSMGSTARVANPTTLTAARNAIGNTMDDILDGVTFTPTAATRQAALDISDHYTQMSPGGTPTPRVRGIVDEIAGAGTNGGPIDLELLRVWRSDLGRLMRRDDEALSTAARQLVGLIDDATDASLIAAGRHGDVQRLAQARVEWRNYLAVRDASTRAGTNGGVMTPENLESAIIRTQGRDAFAHAGGTDLMEISRAGGEMFRSAPTVNPGGVRGIQGIENFSAAGLLGAAGYNMAGAPGALAGVGAGLLVPPAGRAMMRSRTVQSLINNPTLSAAVAARTVPGLLANREP